MSKCEICGGEFNVLGMHILRTHGIQTKDYYDKYLKKDGDGVCCCGKETNFIKMTQGYRKFCGSKCASSNKETLQKAKKTKLERYGDENYDNREKAKQTSLRKYGSEHFFGSKIGKKTVKDINQNKSPEEKQQRIDKIRKTTHERYGVDNVFQLSKVKNKSKETKLARYGNENYVNLEKAKETNLEKFGTEYYYQSEESRNKHKQYHKEKYINKINDYIEKYKPNIELINCDDMNNVEFKCLDCNEVFFMQSQMFRIRCDKKEVICNLCNPYKTGPSRLEKELLEFVTNNYDGEIMSNTRTIIRYNLELDIYLPNIKLAIEFNGVYYHNELFNPDNYHLNKTELCEEKGIHLIHVYEDDWVYRQDIVKSRILNLLGKSNIIYARNCEIREVKYKETNSFLKSNHIQGACNSKYNMGLFYNNELVSIMTFGKLRVNLGYKNEEGVELLRFCNKLNHSIVGGANRLFKYFKEKYECNKIISYADRSWTCSNKESLYDKLGFEFDSVTIPNYYYVVNNIRENRFKYRKSELVELGYDKNKTEREIMFERGIFRIYNSGNLKYVWER